VWPSHYLPFKVILVASAPGEADLPVVARSIETAMVRPPPLKHNSSTKHTVVRQMLKKRRKKHVKQKWEKLEKSKRDATTYRILGGPVIVVTGHTLSWKNV